MSSLLLAINIKGKDRIEVFARTMTTADEGRAWLEDAAGETISWITREIIDPMSYHEHGGGSLAPSSPGIDPSELPENFHQQLYESMYQSWADEPIPALDNQTPRQSLETPGGHRQVVDLLESYERNEKQQAASEGRSMADFGFLWRELGLERTEKS